MCARTQDSGPPQSQAPHGIPPPGGTLAYAGGTHMYSPTHDPHRGKGGTATHPRTHRGAKPCPPTLPPLIPLPLPEGSGGFEACHRCIVLCIYVYIASGTMRSETWLVSMFLPHPLVAFALWLWASITCNSPIM